MKVDPKSLPPVLYSTCTQLAYKINEKYYNDIHFVWCAPAFNCINQPTTSDPQTICNRFLEIATKGDRHLRNEITEYISGVLRGANYKKNKGIITQEQFNCIGASLVEPNFEAFFPVIYIIYTDKVKNKIKLVNPKDCASNESKEYKIENLKRNEFSIIDLKDLLHNIILPAKGGIKL
jgi:hypothetical protein